MHICWRLTSKKRYSFVCTTMQVSGLCTEQSKVCFGIGLHMIPTPCIDLCDDRRREHIVPNLFVHLQVFEGVLCVHGGPCVVHLHMGWGVSGSDGVCPVVGCLIHLFTHDQPKANIPPELIHGTLFLHMCEGVGVGRVYMCSARNMVDMYGTLN